MIHETEWLDRAKRLAIGMHVRVKHLNERRQNMVIAHESDRYWCYCQACKEGGVVMKDHVLLGDAPPVPAHANRLLPTDLCPATEQPYVQPISGFLARKGMDFTFFGGNSVHYSPSQRRLVVQDAASGTSLGRDLTDRSAAKWIVYNTRSYTDGKYLGGLWPHPKSVGVVVEDAFSYFKLKWALRMFHKEFCVCCALGTRLSDNLVLDLTKYKGVVLMLDGDTAGLNGVQDGLRRLKGVGIPCIGAVATWGLDPKDMQLQDIVQHVHTAAGRLR